jgi:hypothetical protein
MLSQRTQPSRFVCARDRPAEARFLYLNLVLFNSDIFSDASADSKPSVWTASCCPPNIFFFHLSPLPVTCIAHGEDVASKRRTAESHFARSKLVDPFAGDFEGIREDGIVRALSAADPAVEPGWRQQSSMPKLWCQGSHRQPGILVLSCQWAVRPS